MTTKKEPDLSTRFQKGYTPHNAVYDPTRCDEAMEYLAEGHSITALAGKFRVDRRTIFRWKKDHPEFGEAVDIGIHAAAAFWEDVLIVNAKEGRNCTGAIFGLKNRAHEDWRDVQRHELGGLDGKPIQTEGKTTIDVTGLTPEQLRALASIRVPTDSE